MITVTFHYSGQPLREVPLPSHTGCPCVVIDANDWDMSELVLHFESATALGDFALRLQQIATDLVCRNSDTGHPVNPTPLPEESELPF